MIQLLSLIAVVYDTECSQIIMSLDELVDISCHDSALTCHTADNIDIILSHILFAFLQ